MLFHINSNFRNRNLYPFSTEFVIPINATPPSNSYDIDSRSYLLADANLLFSFVYYSTLSITFTLISTQKVMVQLQTTDITIPNAYFFQNTFNGILLKDTESQFSSIISNSNFNQKGELICLLLDPLDIPLFVSRNGILINPSNQWSSSMYTNILVNGFSKYNISPGSRELQDEGISNSCILINMTQKQYFSIQSVKTPYRNAIISPVQPSESPITFTPGDYIIVYNYIHDSRIPLVSILNYSSYSASSIHVIDSSHYPILPSRIFKHSITQLSLEIRSPIHQTTDWKTWNPYGFKMIHPGLFPKHLYPLPNYTLRLVDVDDPSVFLTIVASKFGFSFVVEQIPPSIDIHRSRYLFFWLVQKNAIPIYAYILDIDYLSNRIFTETPILPFYASTTSTDTIPYDTLFYSIGGFILVTSVFPNLIYPISNNAFQCYVLELTSLTLPNRPICGTNSLLSDLPYVLVYFGNTIMSNDQSKRSTNIGSMLNKASTYSNNPYVNNVATFICSIADIRNPDINQFIVINSYQLVTMKINFQQDIQFGVFLPNGKILTFSPVYTLSTNNQEIINVPTCPTTYDTYNESNLYTVYSSLDETFVSATFSIRSVVDQRNV